MRELSQILDAFESLAAEGKPAAIATVIAVGGSSYRRPGARMLVASDGRTWGGISGGCLERDVARRARAVIETGQSVLCRYDTTESPDDVDEPSTLIDLGRTPGVTLGCRGTIDLFIERVSADRPGVVPAIAQAVRDRRAAMTWTLLRASPDLPESDPALREAIRERLPGACPLSYGHIHHFTLPGDHAADVFIETIHPPQSLVIFGGGSDVVPVMELARTVGWHVTIVAGRGASGAGERFAAADVLRLSDADDPTGGLVPEPGAAVVLMTHDYPRDVKILASLANRPIRYLGILGPRSRTERLLASASGCEQWNLHFPIGLDLGADQPELIALAIVAEIQAALAGRPGGMLRDRPGPIYPREARCP